MLLLAQVEDRDELDQWLSEAEQSRDIGDRERQLTLLMGG